MSQAIDEQTTTRKSRPTQRAQTLDQGTMPITKLTGVGPRIAERLQHLRIHNVQDLLFHLPLRYEDRTRVVPIGSLRHGDDAIIQGKVLLTEIKYAKRRMLVSRISDGTGTITLRFFHFNTAQQNILARGRSLRCFGSVRYRSGGLEMIHPEYQRINNQRPTSVDEYLTPIYPITEGLHQLRIRNILSQALEFLEQGKLHLTELLPEEILDQLKLPTLVESLLYVHRPPPDAPIDVLAQMRHVFQQRLAFEELLAHYLSLRQLRAKTQQHDTYPIQPGGELVKKFVDRLPFYLTNAQQRVVDEIVTNMQANSPMQRLVQGDVGCGKTVVAALAVVHVIQAGYQVAIMAPTELLAEQHFNNFKQWLTPLDVQVAWLSGKLKAQQRKTALAELASGDAQMVVGTHALFQEEVEFSKLALVIIDEQHRFGVHQRLALREKGIHAGRHPHQLIMTATPIPRTLAMTVYADLDYSVINELPPGRIPVETVVLPDNRRNEVVQRVHQACRDKRQVYWVCTLIEESEALQCEAAENTATLLSEAFPELRVGLVHGRMNSSNKEETMASFKAGKTDLLVATTVIEVGVDVPNASLMIIENAERLGLAQLHQLRGRIGRGSQASCCVLMYHGPLSENGRARLGILRETNDGFAIAQQDLKLRGPGEVLGTKQTGMWQLRIADLRRDQALLSDVNKAAQQIVSKYSQRELALIRRWIGDATQYGDV